MTDTGGAAYVETPPPPALGGLVRAVWSSRAAAGPAAPFRVLPDGCMDLILAWGGSADPELILAGTDPVARMVDHRPGRQRLGLRFRPGCLGALIDCTPRDLLGQSPDAAPLLPQPLRDAARRLLDRPRDARSRQALAAALAGLAETRRRHLPDPALAAALAALDAPALVGKTAAAHGFGQRRFDRAIRRATGLSPRHLARIFRLQRLLAAVMADPAISLAELAVSANFADQPHMTRETRALTGLSTGRLLAELGVRKLQDADPVRGAD